MLAKSKPKLLIIGILSIIWRIPRKMQDGRLMVSFLRHWVFLRVVFCTEQL